MGLNETLGLIISIIFLLIILIGGILYTRKLKKIELKLEDFEESTYHQFTDLVNYTENLKKEIDKNTVDFFNHSNRNITYLENKIYKELDIKQKQSNTYN